jgi:hypothetical protein
VGGSVGTTSRASAVAPTAGSGECLSDALGFASHVTNPGVVQPRHRARSVSVLASRAVRQGRWVDETLLLSNRARY